MDAPSERGLERVVRAGDDSDRHASVRLEEARGIVERALPDRGPWRLHERPWPPGAPLGVWSGRDVTAWCGAPARVRAEREGWARMERHPGRPALVECPDERVFALESLGAELADPVSVASSAPSRPVRLEGTRRELLARLSDEGTARRLGRCVGDRLRRRDLDRWLDARVSVETDLGPSTGGLHPGWYRQQGGRSVVVRCDRAREEGFRALDLAGVALDGRDLAPLRAAHGHGEARDAAFDVALAAVLARELAHGADAALEARLVELVRARPEPDFVRVFIEGPRFLDPHAWEAPGASVDAARARWLLRNLDGLSVGGGRLRVRTEPPIRAGRGAPLREDRAERRRRLFSRWEQGIEVDDEGLLSATPEALALRIAHGARGVVLDGTCGVGALSIAYARQPEVERVIAVDLDPSRAQMARANARAYGVERRVEVVVGDIVELACRVRADLLVLDPPWGGREYDRERVGLAGLGLDVSAALERFAGPVVLKLPRSFDAEELPGFRFEAMVDDRGVLKMLVARRG
jgi:16S rRNA G966 N2-methylase RsmD